MSNRLFSPAYTVEGVTYNTKNGVSFNNMESNVVTVNKGLDANQYATKKTVAQGMLDVALLTANASQLKYVLSVGEQHEFYTIMVALISTSLVLQALTGILLGPLAVLNMKKWKHPKKAEMINHVILSLSMLIMAIDAIKLGFNNGMVVVGVLFMIIGMMNINDPEQQTAANILNNVIVVFIFIISVLNVVLSSFGIENMNINPPGVAIKLNSTKSK